MWIRGGFRGVHPQTVHRPVPVRSGLVRQLVPAPIDPVDPLDLYPFDHRDAHADRPWVMCSMISSADGAVAIDGVSGGLGGEGDQMVFRAVRASCDWIVVAAGTARAERYSIPRPAADVAARRRETGRSKAARLAVVTASVDLDPELPLFADQRPDEPRPLVITGANPPADRVSVLGDKAEWALTEDARPTVATVLAELKSRGAKVVLAEGGPSFNGQLADAGVIDELCVTVSPQLVGGLTPRIVHHAEHAIPAELRLSRLLEHEGELFARYVRR